MFCMHVFLTTRKVSEHNNYMQSNLITGIVFSKGWSEKTLAITQSQVFHHFTMIKIYKDIILETRY